MLYPLLKRIKSQYNGSNFQYAYNVILGFRKLAKRRLNKKIANSMMESRGNLTLIIFIEAGSFLLICVSPRKFG